MENKLDELVSQIPSSFTINGQTYQVELCETVEYCGDPVLGTTDISLRNPKLKLATMLDKLPLSNGTILNTFYHELFHIILSQACIPDTEVKVQSLANLMMQYELSKEK